MARRWARSGGSRRWIVVATRKRNERGRLSWRPEGSSGFLGERPHTLASSPDGRQCLGITATVEGPYLRPVRPADTVDFPPRRVGRHETSVAEQEHQT